jgi:hypothetical protein
LTRYLLLPCALAIAALTLACSSSGEGGREILFTQTDDGCTPESVDVTPGEKLKLTGKNETSDIYELEGTNGTELEEVIIPEGRKRSVGYTVPDEEGTHDVKCYQPGGASTIVKLVAGSGVASDEGSEEEDGEGVESVGGNDEPADTVVQVDLTEYSVAPSESTVASGNIQFDASNLSDSQVHELAVLRVKDDGGFDVVGEIEDIPAGADGTIRLQLDSGEYELSCLIVPGEAGSTTDHYAEGMHAPLTVE